MIAYVYRAPGRVNLIGEHTDYNDGWVLPAAISLAATCRVQPHSGRQLWLRSAQFPDAMRWDLDAPLTPSATALHWSDTLRGVVALLQHRGAAISGGEITLDSTVPIGAGLSSSAATEVALAGALAGAAGMSLPAAEMAVLCRQASHLYGGTRCGLMDYFAALHGHRGQFLLLDTRSLAITFLPWPGQRAGLLVCNTGVHHHHASNEYNLRRQQCEQAAHLLDVTSLREATLASLESAATRMGAVLLARARHVVTENQRTLDAATALTAGDMAALGGLLNASHASLRDDYQVSCPELDTMAELCQRDAAVYGARMMGGGFGGCVLALTRRAGDESLAARVATAYRSAIGQVPQFWYCQPADGAAALV